jgi:hypothetical protein
LKKTQKIRQRAKEKKNSEWFIENCAKEKLVKRLQSYKPKNDNCRRENGFCQVGSSERNTVHFHYVIDLISSLLKLAQIYVDVSSGLFDRVQTVCTVN